MTIEQLRQFLTVARFLSFSAAAEHLYVHQSSVSRNIANIEKEFGVNLFSRYRHTLKLTEMGTLLFEEGEKLMNNYEGLVNKITSAAAGMTGSLYISTLPNYMQPLTEIFNIFMTEHPEVRSYFTNVPLEYEDEITERVRDGSVDVGVRVLRGLPDWLKEEFESIRLFGEQLCIITSVDHPFSADRTVELQELSGKTLISHNTSNTVASSQINPMLESMGLPPMRKVPKDQAPATVEEALMRVRAGMGATIMPATAARQFLWRCRLYYISGIDLSCDVVMFWRRENQKPALRAFTRVVRENHAKLRQFDNDAV